MNIKFEIAGRKFEINTISKHQVSLREIGTVKDEESENFGKESYTQLGYHYNELCALEKLSDYVPLTQELINDFNQLREIRQKTLDVVLELKATYGIK